MSIQFKKFLIVIASIIIAGLINYPIYLYVRNLSITGKINMSFDVISALGQIFALILIFLIYKLLKRFFIKQGAGD
jgi:hypothetical protein